MVDFRATLFVVLLATSLTVPLTTPVFHREPMQLVLASENAEKSREIGPTQVAGDAVKLRAVSVMEKLPLRFEEDSTRGGNGARFIARAAGFDAKITPTEAVMYLRPVQTSDSQRSRSLCSTPSSVPATCSGIRGGNATAATLESPRTLPSVAMRLVRSNRHARLIGEDQLTARTNYFIGNDEAQWSRDVPNYARVRCERIYRGIDLTYYGSNRQLEYDFKVASGASYKAIHLRFSGAQPIRIEQSGDLVIDTEEGQIREHKPVAYQVVAGERREIAARYIVLREREIGFSIGSYDRRRPLIIDPVLNYSSFFGGEGNDIINSVAVDAQGNAYVAGTTNSSDLTVTQGAVQPNGNISPGLTTCFVAKFDLTNTRLVYSTYLGGGSAGPSAVFASSSCLAVAIDFAGDAYITGWTGAVDFPATPNAFQRVLAGGIDAFVAKLNPGGNALAYSTYLGSSRVPTPFSAPLDEGLGIAVDAGGSAYVTGRTIGMDFPVTAGALKTTHDHDIGAVGGVDPVLVSHADAFVTKLNPTGTALTYSTYLGGAGDDLGNGVKVDASGNCYVAGVTRARDFPTSNAAQSNLAGGSDAFIAKLNRDASGLIYSTYVGGTSDDTGKSIDLDESGNVYFAGVTASTDLSVTPNAFQQATADVSIYKSTNAGGSWFPSNVGMPGNAWTGLFAIDPASGFSVYTNVSGYVFRSTDGGRQWTNSVGEDRGPLPTHVLAFDPKKPSTVYGVMDSGFFFPQILRSIDGGQTWENITAHFPTRDTIRQIIDLSIDPVNTTSIYVSTEQGLFKVTDGVNVIGRGNGLPGDGADARILAIDLSNSNRLFASASEELFISTNGGKRWSTSSLTKTSVFNVTIDPITTSTVYASGGGLFKSTDSGESWQEVDNDLMTFGVGKVVIDPANTLVMYTTTRAGIFKSADGGHHWIAINAGLGPYFRISTSEIVLAIDPRNPSILYARGIAAGSDAFVGKLNASGSAFVYLSYLGGTGIDAAMGLTVDTAGCAYVTGQSESRDFPVNRAFQPDKLYSAADLFVTKLTADGSGLSYSTYLGGSGQEYVNGIDVDRSGSAYIVGYSYSPDFPLDNNLQTNFRVTEGFLSRIADTRSSQPPPMIADIGPAAGSSAGQFAITILGSSFLPGASVRIGGVPVTITQLTSNMIRGIANRRDSPMAEAVDLVVSNPDGQSAVRKNGFTYLPVPRISGVSLHGKELVVFGVGFDKGASIILESSPQKTRLDVSGSIDQVILLSRKAAKKIASGQTVMLQVSNVYGLTSEAVSFTRP